MAIPLAVTTARPVPCATSVPLKIMLSLSPTGAGSRNAAASLSTASLSPVRDASCSRSDVASNRRASAPTASPSPSTSKSPRTNSTLGTRRTCPSRMTAEVTAVIRAKAATASAALASCTKPKTALSRTIVAITIASTGQPTRPSIVQATSAMVTATSNR